MPRILYVDDDIDDLNFLREAFLEIDSSIQIKEVNNGVEALQHLETLKADLASFPALIIMDINMPLMDGRMTIKRIKEDIILRTIPIVAFTTSNNPMDKLVCGQMGVKCVLKPNSALELKEIAKEFLQTYVYSR
jgi:CheY-like chemotaxis protein